MTESFREFQGDTGPVLIRRDKVGGIRKGLSIDAIADAAFPPMTSVLVGGKWLFVTDKYEAVRDWALG